MFQKGIILITDSFPWKNGGGISQTLYNLFEGYYGDMWILMPEKEMVPPLNECIRAERIPYNPVGAFTMPNRLGRWLNTYARQLQFSLQTFKRLPANLPDSRRAVLMVSTTDPAKLQIAYLLAKKKGYAIIPYFMDDWMDGRNPFWIGGSLQKITAYLLKHAKARLMISEQLEKILVARYQLAAVPTHIVHNPCPYIPQSVPEAGQASFSGSLIIYSGSVWPMHADALIAFAKAIHLSHQSGGQSFMLYLYIPKAHWKNYAQQLVGPGVAYKGWLSYAAVLKEIPRAWMLLCTASFQSLYAPFSRSSVQTKLTDYIAAGRPVLVVGPPNAASGEWVVNRGCGKHFNNPASDVLLQDLRACFNKPEAMTQMANKASLLAKGPHATKTVQKNLYQFLEHVI